MTEWKYVGDKLYISTILDLYDRYPVGVVVSKRNDIQLVNVMAIILNQGATPLLHSDRGFQYTRKVFSQMLEDDGLTQSMS
ncbi:DDE-type integrase/transposase/recombinase [Absicoccus porci]|uniref:DDE-type integrase/transposase/recombinase n=1 Tax=Absicoccus porci TaxID=2486576 RepID=UPI003F891D6F